MNGDAPTVARVSPAMVAGILPASLAVTTMVTATSSAAATAAQRAQRLRGAAIDMEHRPKDEQQALRAIDPGAAVEDGAAAPEAGDLGVPALVGGEGGAEEGQADEHGQRHGGGDGERWGPPRRNIDRPTAVLAGVAFAIALLAQILTFGVSLTPDRYVLVLLAPALVLGRGRRFMLDFVPFVLLIVLYEESRGIAHTLHPSPYYLPQLDIEKFLFFGHVPTVVLQNWLWTGHLQWYDQFLSFDDPGALHRPADARVRAVAEAAGALLPLRRDAARALLRGRVHLLAVPGRAALGGGGQGPDPAAGQPGRRAGGQLAAPDRLRARSTTWSTATRMPRSRRCTRAMRCLCSCSSPCWRGTPAGAGG